MKTFSERLAFLMGEQRFNNSSLGRSLGVTHSTVARWLAGSVPNSETLHSLAQILNVTAQWLLEGDGGMNAVRNPEGKPAIYRTSPGGDKKPSSVGEPRIDPQRDETLAKAKEFNEALEPDVRKAVRTALRKLDGLLSTAADNDGAFHSSMIRLSHECIDEFSDWSKAKRAERKKSES